MIAREDIASGHVYRTLPVNGGFLFVLPAVPIGVGLLALVYRAAAGWAAWATVAVGIVAAWILYRTAHTIVLRERDAAVEFRSVLRMRVVPVVDISSIEFSRVVVGELVVVHPRGAERMIAEFPGVGDVVEWIRAGKPEIRVPAVFDR